MSVSSSNVNNRDDTAGEFIGMSPTSVTFYKRFLIRTLLLSSSETDSGAVGFLGSYKVGDLYEPVDLCHLVIANISFAFDDASNLSL